MIEHETNVLTADVRVSETLDGLIIIPRQLKNVRELRKYFQINFPGLHARRSPEGVWISSENAEILLELSVPFLIWSTDASLFAENRRRAKQVYPGILDGLRQIKEGGMTVAQEFLAGVRGLGVLDQHQWVNVAAMTLPNSFGLCVFDEQGAGKTVTLIFAFDVLVARDQADFALIVAPKSMIAEWPRDFCRFKTDLYKVRVVAGTAKEKRAAIRSGADVLVTNFETTVSMEAELRAVLRGRKGRAVLVVDESFYIKSLDAKRTMAIRRLREWCDRAYVLCGTPAPNAPHDLIQQLGVVDFGIAFSDVEMPTDREMARPVVQAIIKKKGLLVRHLKADVLPDLPMKQFHRILVPLQPVQARLYQSTLDNLIVDLQGTDDLTFRRQLTSFFARRSALLQICSHPSAVAESYTETPAKLLAMDRLLDEAVTQQREKVVIWSFYTESINAIMKRFAHFNPVRYDGTIADVNERREAVRKFQEDPQTMLFVGNPAAAGAGLTLHSARLAIYESMSNQAAHYLQSLDRIHRRGQRRKVEYLILLCNETLEIHEYDRLTEKEHAAQDLLGDRVSVPASRMTMLSELEQAQRLITTSVGATCE